MDHKKMIKREMRERFGENYFRNYTYFQTPDGEDLFKKLLYTSKFSFAVGTLLGLSNAIARAPSSRSTKERIIRFSMIMMPCLGISASYTLVTYYSTRLRKQDDEINHFLGGVAAGKVLGAALKSSKTGWITGIIIGIIAAGVKTVHLNGQIVFYDRFPRRNFSSYYIRNRDLSLIKDDIRGNWTK